MVGKTSMTSTASREYDIDKMNNEKNAYQIASNKRILIKLCSKCNRTIGEIGGMAFRTSARTWYCSDCNPLRRLR